MFGHHIEAAGVSFLIWCADVDHDGHTNLYHVNAQTELAMRCGHRLLSVRNGVWQGDAIHALGMLGGGGPGLA